MTRHARVRGQDRGVARPGARGPQRERDGVGAVRAADRVRRADERRERLLEARDLVAEDEPARVEHAPDRRLDLVRVARDRSRRASRMRPATPFRRPASCGLADLPGRAAHVALPALAAGLAVLDAQGPAAAADVAVDSRGIAVGEREVGNVARQEGAGARSSRSGRP